ncbi:hypothetical protein Scep_002824 [Stephania cephalantha]|uniref:F-box domain-containing protein n=1 Tax=Stephania cephalantha TaxID=152367 RepID=A0AAP0Q5C3_9MAGN
MKKGMVAVEDTMCEGVIIGILSRLPAKSVLRFKSVCKAWRTLIEEHFFVEKHFEQLQRGANTRPDSIMFVNYNDSRLYSLDIESLSLSCDEEQVELPEKVLRSHNYLLGLSSTYNMLLLLGSCNGLICMQNGKSISLWNPCTRTYSQVVYPPKDTQFVRTMTFGFGYDAKVKDYKLVRITCFHDQLEQQNASEVKVLTLSTNTWRRLYYVPYNVGSTPGKLINGALHWIDVYRNLLICFNVEEEKVKEMAKPVYMTNNKVRNVRVFELAGCLALVCRSTKKGSDIEVWVMKEYGLENSWTKMFSIDLKRLPCSSFRPHCSCSIRPLHILKNNEGILLGRNNSLVLFKPNGNGYQNFYGLSSLVSSFLTYRGSLVHLDEKE